VGRTEQCRICVVRREADGLAGAMRPDKSGFMGRATWMILVHPGRSLTRSGS